MGQFEVRNHPQPVSLSEAEGSPYCMAPAARNNTVIQEFAADGRRSLHCGRDDSSGGRDDSGGGRDDSGGGRDDSSGDRDH